MTEIDLLVGAYGHTDDTDIRVVNFLDSLCANNDLIGVNVFCVDRAHAPMPLSFKEAVANRRFNMRTCPIPPQSTCREDTGMFSDWMVVNNGNAPGVVLSHFDIEFHGDYISFVRSLMGQAAMIGNHHDGIVAFSRDAYDKCQLGFCGIDEMVMIGAGDDVRIVPRLSPLDNGGRYVLSFDVGELFALRMNTLRLPHIWLQRGNDPGKSSLFSHLRRGSGHGMDGRGRKDAQ